MSLKVIELNDSAIKVGDDSGLLLQSPGFALTSRTGLQLGEAAEQQARLQPTDSYNKYWHELSMEPLSHGNGIRHFADIAYAHLMHLAEKANIDGDVIFAVPGNFTRQQLAILLGLAKQCPFTPLGVVDSALAAAVSVANSHSLIYVDIQLHQVLLTKLTISDSALTTESVIQVPGVGSQNFMDLLMQLTTDLFIQQCRFNPQHNADSEQLLYNALPSWLQRDNENKNSLLMKLNTGSAVHTAKMPRESLVNNLGDYYKKINQQIDALATEKNTQLLVSNTLAALPGFVSSLKQSNNLHILDAETINSACLESQQHILADAHSIHLVNTLPLDKTSSGNTDTDVLELESSKESVQISEVINKGADRVKTGIEESVETNPTHALYSNRAIAVEKLQIKNNVVFNGDGGNALVLSLDELPEQLGHMESSDGDLYLDSGSQEFYLNKKKVSGKQKLGLGDRVKFAENAEDIQLIQVSNA